MELWSYHSPDFSLVDGKVDPEKSDYAKRYRDAYQGLWERVKTDQFVWCCTSQDCWPMKGGSREWVLDVPTAEFFRIVDSMVWNGILGPTMRIGPPERLRSKLVQAANERHRDDPAAWDKWYEEQVQQLLYPPGDPWASLFLSDPNDPRANVLLRHPIQRNWVKSSEVV